jgi:hypothetical protein
VVPQQQPVPHPKMRGSRHAILDPESGKLVQAGYLINGENHFTMNQFSARPHFEEDEYQRNKFKQRNVNSFLL